MLERVITAGVGVVGLAVIGLGVASATVWRADDVLVATASASSPVVVTEPGVLELGGDPVTVRATTADGAPVVLAVGRDTDVAAWVGSDEHQSVTGLAGWHDLALSAATTDPVGGGESSPAASGSPSQAPSPDADAASGDAAVADPTDSDLWVAQATGDGSAELEWPAQSGRWTLLAVAPDGGTPTLSMAWPRTVTTPWLWPCVAVGALLVLASLWWAVRAARRDRRSVRWESVSTGALPQVPAAAGAPMTRRQLREAEAAARARPRTGAIPRVRPAAQPPVGKDAAAASSTGSAPSAAASGTPSSATTSAATTSSAAASSSTSSPSTSSPSTSPAGASAGTGRPAAEPGAASGAGTPSAASWDAGSPRPAPAASGWTPSPDPQPSSTPGSRETAAAVPVGSAAPTVALPAASPAAGAGAGAPASAAPGPAGPDPATSSAAGAVPQLPATVGRPAWLSRAPHHDEAAPGRLGREEPTMPLAPVAEDASADDARRPAWLPTSAGSHEAPATPEAPGGSRADAWRRAWGLPALPTVSDGDRTDDQEAGR